MKHPLLDGMKPLNEFIDSVQRDLEYLLGAHETPIQASRSWASRDVSLSTGTSGIFLALAESSVENVVIQFDSDIHNIFGAEIKEGSNGLRLENAAPDSEQDFLGDIFVGEANRIWSRFCLGIDQKSSLVTEGQGSINRPGLGHGELARDLARFINQTHNPAEPFNTQELHFDSFGWCNGYAGLMVATGIYDNLTTPGKASRPLLELLDRALQDLDSQVEQEIGLCHGLSGLAVVTAGISRSFSLPNHLERAINSFDKIVTAESLLRIPATLDVDASWLTGAAGVVWASRVIRKQPSINPIFPIDSSTFSYSRKA